MRCLIIFISIFCLGGFSSALASEQQTATIQQKLTNLEKSFNGKIGVYVVNTANNQSISHHAHERFPVQSTFKFLGASAILERSMQDKHLLQQTITYNKQDLIAWSPITKQHVGKGMTVEALAGAAVMYSDNTAINLLMKKLGGPQAVTVFAHSIGNNSFRVDHYEANLNSNPNNIQDTATPKDMENSLYGLALGKILAPAQRSQLVAWLKGCTTGAHRIRAGAPKGWVVGDKTGTGSYGVTNDVAILWPPHCAPIVMAVYIHGRPKDAPNREDVVTETAHLVLMALAKNDPCLQSAMGLKL